MALIRISMAKLRLADQRMYAVYVIYCRVFMLNLFDSLLMGARRHFIATPSLVDCLHLFPQLSPASSSSSSGQNYFSLAMNWPMPGRTGKTKCVISGPDVAERSFQNGMALCPASMGPNGKSGGSGFQAHRQLQFSPCLFKSQLCCRQNVGPVKVHRSALQKMVLIAQLPVVCTCHSNHNRLQKRNVVVWGGDVRVSQLFSLDCFGKHA